MDRTDFEGWTTKDVARLLALVENQRRYYHDIVSELPVGLVALSASRAVVSANRAFRQAFGLSVQDLRGKTIEQILPSERLIEKIRDVALNPTSQPGFPLVHGGKQLRIAVLPLRNWDDEGELETLLMVSDVTDAQTAPAVRGTHTESAAASPAEALPALVWRANTAGLQFTAVTGPAELMAGYSPAHWLKSANFFAQRIHREDRDAVLALYRSSIQHSREVSAEFRMVTASGEPLWCRETVRLAGPGSLAGVLTAIGQRRQMEQLRITGERNAALRGISARLAHDLNNPLMIISGYAEEMLHPLAADDPRRGDLEEILAATERIGNLTAQLLQFTRRQASPAERVDLSATLAGLGDASVEVRAPKPVWALANPRQLEEILLTLISSAREGASARTRVIATCDTASIREQIPGSSLAPAAYACLTLHAAGRGMDAEKSKEIFESFLHKEVVQPAGAALAQAYTTVREWGGEIAFASELSRGSTFTVYLPLAESEPPPAEPASKAARVAAPSASVPSRETILAVDDEAGIRALIVKILRRERYLVLEAGSAAEAVAVAATHQGPIHLLLTDVMLPDRNGRELAQQLTQALPDLKVMYISGFTDDESLRAGEFPPGARFLQKPFTLGGLMETVREALDR